MDNGAKALELLPQSADLLLRYALIRCPLGRDAEGLHWLKRAVRLGVSTAQFDAYPEFEHLREHPRFRETLALAS